MTVKRAAAAALTALVAMGLVGAGSSCATTLDAGTYGVFRYAARIKGEPPLDLLPPIADRSGNLYLLYGSLGLPFVESYAGGVAGGWSSACANAANGKNTKGDRYGAHGWVGYSSDRAWYWSGDALVKTGEATQGACSLVLDTDPGTNASVRFRAVLPWVRDATTRASTVALVQSPTDPAPYSALVDLDHNLFSNINPFQPGDATDVKVLGVGASRDDNLGFLLVSYVRGSETRVEGRFFDAAANQTAAAPISVREKLDDFAIQGFLERSAQGLVVGLAKKSLVVFDHSGGKSLPVTSMDPVGVHYWSGRLFLVGLRNQSPVVAPIDDATGTPGAPVPWTASLAANAALEGTHVVTDDRSLPSRSVAWSNVKSAIGAFPFLSPFSPTPYADGQTLWAVAGPEYDLGGAKITSVAVVPVGISYP